MLNVCWIRAELTCVCCSPRAATSLNLQVQKQLNYLGFWNREYKEAFCWTGVWSREVFKHMLKSDLFQKKPQHERWVLAAPTMPRIQSTLGRKKSMAGICSGRMFLGETLYHFNILITFTTSNKPKWFLKFQIINQHIVSSLNFNSNSHLHLTRCQETEKSLLPKTSIKFS